MATGINIETGGVTRIEGGVINAASIRAGSVSIGRIHNMEEKTPHTQRRYGPMYNNMSPNEGSGFVESIEVLEEEATWKVEVPDVPREDIELYLLGNTIVVKTPHPRTKERKTSFILAEGETITSVTHELGVLTFKIDRPIKRIPLEIN